MTGTEVAAAIRRKQGDLPIVMASAYLDLPATVLEGVDKYITKGVSPQVMLDAVSSLLSGRGQRKQ